MFRSAFAFCLFASVAQADVSVTFSEGAPKDRFTIQTSDGCALAGAQVNIDLGKSAAGLIFDTTASGAGVEVFQPFELVAGADRVQGVSEVKDGDTGIGFRLVDLDWTTPVAFTIDVDDTTKQREITVSGSEIEGALVTVVHGGKTTSARFGQNAIARVPVAACAS